MSTSHSNINIRVTGAAAIAQGAYGTFKHMAPNCRNYSVNIRTPSLHHNIVTSEHTDVIHIFLDSVFLTIPEYIVIFRVHHE